MYVHARREIYRNAWRGGPVNLCKACIQHPPKFAKSHGLHPWPGYSFPAETQPRTKLAPWLGQVKQCMRTLVFFYHQYLIRSSGQNFTVQSVKVPLFSEKVCCLRKVPSGEDSHLRGVAAFLDSEGNVLALSHRKIEHCKAKYLRSLKSLLIASCHLNCHKPVLSFVAFPDLSWSE